MALSFEEFKQKRAQGLTIQQIKAEESAKSEGPGFLERAGAKLKERGQKIAETFKERPMESTGFRNLETSARVLGQVAGGIGDVAGEAAVSTYKTVVPEIAQEEVKKTGVGLLRTEIGQSALRALEEGSDVYSKWAEANPNASKDIEAVVNIASILPVGKASQIAGKGVLKAGQLAGKTAVKAGKTVAEKSGKVAEFGVSQSTGLSPSTIRNIIDNPDVFSPKELAKIDRESLGRKVRTSVEKRLNELRGTGKEYETIKKSGVTTTVSENTFKDLLKERGINLEDGKIKVDLESDIQLSKADAKGLEEVASLLKGKENLSAKEILNLRTRLSNLAGFGEGKTDASKIIAKELRTKIDAIAKKEIPGLEDLDLKFAPERKLLSNIKKDFFDKDGRLKDNALSKIANLTGKGKEKTLERMEKIIPGIKKDVNILKAIEDIEYAQGQKVGAYWRAGGAVAGATAGGPVGALVGAIVSSPQVAVSLLRAYGKLKNKATKGIIEKMQKGKTLIDSEKQLLKESIDDGIRKIEKRK